MKRRGRFITFEGIEGSGKSTLVDLVANNLRDLGEIPVITREPGGSGLGRLLRPILLNVKTDELSNLAELYLFLADRAQHMQEEILPSLALNKTVLCDRFADSTIAYQAYGRGLDLEMTRMLAINKEWMPDLTLLFDIDPEMAIERARKRNEVQGTCQTEGRFDQENLNFHKRVRKGYLEQAALSPERIKIVNATGSRESVLARCLAAIAEKFGEVANWQA